MVVKLLETEDCDQYQMALTKWIKSIDKDKKNASISWPSSELDAEFYVRNKLNAASDWDVVRVEILRFHSKYKNYQSCLTLL